MTDSGEGLDMHDANLGQDDDPEKGPTGLKALELWFS